MKRVAIWVPALAILAIAVALAASCSPSAAPVAEAAKTCDLKAASASAAEAALAGCDAKWIDANVTINQLQSMGTHNSYKEQIPEVEMALIRERSPDAATLEIDVHDHGQPQRLMQALAEWG